MDLTGQPAGRAPAGAVLGISAKSLHADAAEKPPIDHGRYLAARRGKYEALRTAQSILFDPSKPAALQHRTCWCQRGTPTPRENISVYRRADASSARLQGVTTCGNVWTCPLCSARIAEARREELEQLLKGAVAQGHHAYLMTLTFPHSRPDLLSDLLERQAKALARFKNSRAFKALRVQWGRVGSVRSMECTYGENGWHPHTHDVMIAKPGLLDQAILIDTLRGAWIDALGKVGLCPPEKRSWAMLHAFDIRGGAKTAEYISKFGRDAQWGISREVTGQRAKVGMRAMLGTEGHCTPFQVLAWAQSGDAEAAGLFRVYAAAYAGKRMLYWSPGLKRTFAIDDIDDEAAAAADRPDESRVGVITVDQLGQLHARRALGAFIELAATHCTHQDDDDANQAELDDIIDYLIAAPPDSSGLVRRKAVRGYAEYDPSVAVESPRRFPLH